METIITNILIVGFAVFVYVANHVLETRDLEAIERKIEEELKGNDEQSDK